MMMQDVFWAVGEIGILLEIWGVAQIAKHMAESLKAQEDASDLPHGEVFQMAADGMTALYKAERNGFIIFAFGLAMQFGGGLLHQCGVVPCNPG